jgi:hypothetical protein
VLDGGGGGERRGGARAVALPAVAWWRWRRWRWWREVWISGRLVVAVAVVAAALAVREGGWGGAGGDR